MALVVATEGGLRSKRDHIWLSWRPVTDCGDPVSDATVFEVRIHGRGGQGVVTAAELLSVAAFDGGRHAQAFPSFGSERTGAPVVSYCRFSDQEIRSREPVMTPDAVVIQDATLIHQVDLLAGLDPDGYVLVNTSRAFGELDLGGGVALLRHERLLDLPGHRARDGAPRATPSQRRAAGGLRRPHRPGPARSHPARRSASASPARSPTATPPPRPRPSTTSPASAKG